MFTNKFYIQALKKNFNLIDVFETALSSIDKQVTVHPYGFYVIKIESTINFQVRLHVWLKDKRERQSPDWPAHDHNHKIYSTLLKGRLHQTIWETTPDQQAKNVIYKVSYRKGSSLLKKTKNSVNLSQCKTETFSSGESYFLPRHAIHSVGVDLGSSAVTLSVFFGFDCESPRVIGEKNGAEEYVFARGNVKEREKRIIKKEIEFLKKELFKTMNE